MKKRLGVFLEFLIGGIFLGIIEDIILIKILSSEPITFQMLGIILLVTIPFAFVGEYVVDRINFIKLFNLNKKYRKVEVFLEFLIFGIILGVVEDLIALHFTIAEQVTPEFLLIVVLVTIPFAFVGEYILDRIHLTKSINEKKILKRKD